MGTLLKCTQKWTSWNTIRRTQERHNQFWRFKWQSTIFIFSIGQWNNWHMGNNYQSQSKIIIFNSLWELSGIQALVHTDTEDTATKRVSILIFWSLRWLQYKCEKNDVSTKRISDKYPLAVFFRCDSHRTMAPIRQTLHAVNNYLSNTSTDVQDII